MQINPGWRGSFRQHPGRRFRNAGVSKRLTGDPCRGIKARAKAVDHRNWYEPGDAAPALPAMEAAQIIGAHDPDEMDLRTTPHQIFDGLVSVGRADLRLETGNVDARMGREPPRRQHAVS